MWDYAVPPHRLAAIMAAWRRDSADQLGQLLLDYQRARRHSAQAAETAYQHRVEQEHLMLNQWICQRFGVHTVLWHMDTVVFQFESDSALAWFVLNHG